MRSRRLWGAALAVSLLPDADVLGFSFGVRYEDFLGHRGFFHSPFFSLVLSSACLLVLFRDLRPLTKRWWEYLTFLFLLGSSHGLLDALTDGGLGIALLAPFNNRRFFFPWTPIPVAPIGLSASFSEWGIAVILWEATHILAPACAVLAAVKLLRHKEGRRLDGDSHT